jgi:TDG/mug DNA glycosylase family protein
VLLVGINPSLWSAAIGHHFGNPANRLWPTLHQAGFTPRRLLPIDSDELLALRIGVTNLVARATATAAEITDDELRAGAPVLVEKVERYRPGTVAFLGLTAYRVAFGEPKAKVGPQPDLLGGAPVWLLPNPSGLNAHYQLPDLVRVYAELRAALYLGRARAAGPVLRGHAEDGGPEAVPTLETDRLLLRPFEERDLDAYAAIVADPEVMRYVGGEALDRSAAWRQMALFLGHERLRGWTLNAVVERATGRLLGRCGLWRPEGWPGLEVGWALGRFAWGHGFATEAALAWRDWTFGVLGAEELVSIVHRDNLASHRVAERIGHHRLRELEVNGLPCVLWGQPAPA